MVFAFSGQWLDFFISSDLKQALKIKAWIEIIILSFPCYNMQKYATCDNRWQVDLL